MGVRHPRPYGPVHVEQPALPQRPPGRPAQAAPPERLDGLERKIDGFIDEQRTVNATVVELLSSLVGKNTASDVSALRLNSWPERNRGPDHMWAGPVRSARGAARRRSPSRRLEACLPRALSSVRSAGRIASFGSTGPRSLRLRTWCTS